MARPLPPIVHGPILPFSPSVRVTAVAAGATVEILVAGNSIGAEFSPSGGTLLVPVGDTFVAGQSVTARQSTDGGLSDPSAQPVVVVDIPIPPPAPRIISPLSTCMSMMKLDGLLPGATVLVHRGGTLVAQLFASHPVEFVAFPQGLLLNAGDRLRIVQQIDINGVIRVSPPVFSMPLPAANREEPLPAPGIGQPLSACQTGINFLGMTPSADVTIENEGNSGLWLNVDVNYHGWGGPPLREGQLVARQRYPRCDIESSETVVDVGPPIAPGQPVIQAAPCPKVRRVRLSGLEPGALLVLSTVTPVPATPGTSIISPIGEAVVSSRSEDFDLPLGIEAVTDTGEAVLLTAQQILCGLPGPDAARVGFATPGGPFGAPTITTPLFECGLRVAVTGSHPSSLLEPFYADSGAPIGDAVLAPGREAGLLLWFPLESGREVLVRQFGCDADGDSPVVRVTDLPNELPVPQILGPVRPHATGVRVRGALPGARLHLLVNEIVRRSIDVFEANPTIPTADLALAVNDELWAIQTHCANESNIEGQRTRVRKGNMTVAVQPSMVQRGSSAVVTVTANDADTQEAIRGARVFLDGTLVGQSGVPFTFAPAIGQTNPSGRVSEPVAHHDASFTITLTNPPPVPTGKLFLNVGPTVLIPNTLRLVSAAWKVTSLWTPVQNPTSSGANAFVTLPAPPPSPADQRVSVALDTTWEVAGLINGIPFAHQQFKGHLNPNPTLLAWAGTNLTAGWMVIWGIEYDNAGNPWVIVTTTFQGAQ